jgi:predicted dehydrogenase/type 1 glutamine amidotransferase
MAKNVLLITGGTWHDFATIGKMLARLLEEHGYTVEQTGDRQSFLSLPGGKFGAVVIYTCDRVWTAEQAAALEKFIKAGGACVAIHSANAVDKGTSAEYVKVLGSRFAAHGPQVEYEVQPTDPAHFISKHMQSYRVFSELYLLGDVADDIHVLATAHWQNQPAPMMYVRHLGAGRLFYTAVGHHLPDFQVPEWQKLFLRGLRWALGAAELPTLKVATVGYGTRFNMARLHLTQARDAGLVPVASCDIDPACNAAAEKDHPGIKTYTDYKQLLQESDADIVSLVLPHNLHAPVALEVLASGRHCITEKPMAVSGAECDAMIAAAAQAGKMLSTYHNRRWDGDFLALDEVVNRRKLIGDVFKVECFHGGYHLPGRWWRSDRRISGGMQYDWGAHFMFWALALTPGKPEWVVGNAHKRVWHQVDNYDHLEMYARFDSGASLDFEISSIAKAGKPKWRILGTKGAIVDRGENKQFELARVEQEFQTAGPATVRYQADQWHRYYLNIADHLRLDDALEITPRKAARVIRVLEAMEKAGESGQQERVENW